MLHAVIMAGGSGTRFWPESRVDRPKQLLELLGDRTMLQATVERLDNLVPPNRILVATTARLAKQIASQLPQLSPEAILTEPCKRDTAPCIGLAAIRLVRDDPDATMAVMPSDHVIDSRDRFRDAIHVAEGLVEENPQRLVTLGITPAYPAESFGYIERQQPLESAVPKDCEPWPSMYRVEKFHEKPEAEVARQYLEAGTFYWNSGIFVWKAQTILDLLARHEPVMFAHLERIGQADGTPRYDEVLEREFSAIEGVSIDFAVMERALEVVVVEAPFGWSDVGTWRALERLLEADASGNVVDAQRSLMLGASGNVVRSGQDGHLVVLVGVEDLVVIVTPDATLVANKHDEESLRKVTQQIREKGWNDLL